MRHIQLVHRVELELDLLPGLHGDLELWAVLGRAGKDLFAFLLELTALVARLNAGLEGHAVRGRAGGVAPGVAERAAPQPENRGGAEERQARRPGPDLESPR